MYLVSDVADVPERNGARRQSVLGDPGQLAGVSQIEHSEVTSVDVIARYVEAIGGRLDLVADFGDRTVRLPVSDTATAA